MEHLPYALAAIKVGAPHVETAAEAAQRRFSNKNGNRSPTDPDLITTRTMEEKGYVLKRRSEVHSDEEIVEVVRHRGQVLPRRPRPRRQTSSMEDLRDSRNGDGGRYRRDTGGYGSESEGSVPPRSRQRTKSLSGRSRRGRSTSSSSSSSSNLGSTTEEEKETKKIRRKKWITAGFASVATIHAASKVYSSIENHDKRVIAVQQGALSPEDAHKQARSARWQDAAAIGLAALGIKGAISEWKEMAEEHEKHKEMCQQHEENHRRRLERIRRQKARESVGYYKARDGNWYYDGQDVQDSERRGSNKLRSSSTWDSYGQLDGPRNGDRKMIEAPPDRSRSVYSGRDRSRSRAYNDRDDNRSPVRNKSRNGPTSNDCDHPSHDKNPITNPLMLGVLATPILGYAAYKLTKAELTDDTILKMNPEKEEYLKTRDLNRHEEYKDFAADTLEEILDHVG